MTINIDRIARGESLYQFPTIDFKFQNTGRATAFLWRFAVLILDVEIDRKPALRFYTKAGAGTLQVWADNRGWGDAIDCTVQVGERFLDGFFEESLRQFRGDIGSGEVRELLVFDPRVKHELFVGFMQALAERQVQLVRETSRDGAVGFRQLEPRPLVGAKLGSLKAEWGCTTVAGDQVTGEAEFGMESAGSQLALTPLGFTEFHEETPVPRGTFSEVTYITIIEPEQHAGERLYPMARHVPPGDVERFHIMIGATMSCRLTLRFKFYVDRDVQIVSDEFDVHIWNPRGSGWHADYQDGAELDRRLHELQCRRQRGEISPSELLELEGGMSRLADARFGGVAGSGLT
jgi:hypothetical protein